MGCSQSSERVMVRPDEATPAPSRPAAAAPAPAPASTAPAATPAKPSNMSNVTPTPHSSQRVGVSMEDVAAEDSNEPQKTLRSAQSRGRLITVPSRRLFDATGAGAGGAPVTPSRGAGGESNPYGTAVTPVSKSIGKSQRRGSFSQAHGLAFTEVGLPADQIISIPVQQEQGQLPRTGDDGPVVAPEEEPAEEMSESLKAAGDRVYQATLEGPAFVIDLLIREPFNRDLVLMCCDAIASLVIGKPENRSVVESHGGFAILVRVLQTFDDDEELQVKACYAVGNLATDYAEVLGELAAVESIVRLLFRFPHSERIQTVGIRTLANLCREPKNLGRAKAHRAAAAVRAAREAFAANGEFYYRSGQFLQQLEEGEAPTLELGGSSRKVMGERIASKRVFDGLGSPKPSMVSRKQKRGSHTQAHGMSFTEAHLPAEQVIGIHENNDLIRTGTLRALMDNPPQQEDSLQNRVYNAVRSGVAAVVTLMQGDPEAAELQAWCCDAIASLCAGNDENRNAVQAMGGIEAVLSAMVFHSGHVRLQTKGCWALFALSAAFCDELVAGGAIQVLVNVLANIQDNDACNIAMRVLSNICKNEAYIPAVRNCHAGKYIRQYVAANAEAGELVFRGQRLLETLGESTDLRVEQTPVRASSRYIAQTPESGGQGGGMHRLESKRLFSGDSMSAISPSVPRFGKQRRGSRSKAHGMSFTEMALPADQILQNELVSALTEASGGPAVEGEAPAAVPETLAASAVIAPSRSEDSVEQQVYRASQQGVHAVMELLKTQEENVEMQRWCLDALASLCTGHEENRAKAHELGAVPQVIRAMLAFEKNITLQQKGLWAVLSFASDYADQLRELGVFEVISRDMRLEDYECQSIAVRAALVLVQSESDIQAAIKVHMHTAVEHVINENAEDGQLQFRATTLANKLRPYAPEEEEEDVQTILQVDQLDGMTA